MSEPLKILVVDDSFTYRTVLREVIRGIPATEVADTAINGEDALRKLAQAPADLVLLDVEMPRMNGIETLEAIRHRYPSTGVVMVSGITASSAERTIQALEYGALDFIRKPAEGDAASNLAFLRDRLKPIIAILQERRQGQPPRREAPKPATPIKAPVPTRVDVLGIAVSTGGPKALMELLPALPGDLAVPVLVVQHMPPVFTASLAESLDRKSAVTVREAAEGELVCPGTVYIAPGGHHMTVVRTGTEKMGGQVRIALNDAPPENSCRPAADVLFRAMAEVYGGHIVTAVLTGMGQDGMEGVRAIKKLPGTYCLTQTAQTCTIYGMPKAVDDAGLSDEQVPLPDMARRLAALARGGVRA